MKKITVTYHYTLFKPLGFASTLYYIRCEVEGTEAVTWVTGYENTGGKVSIVGDSLPLNIQDMLENEYQNKTK
jgi:hypothetical protein